MHCRFYKHDQEAKLCAALRGPMTALSCARSITWGLTILIFGTALPEVTSHSTKPECSRARQVQRTVTQPISFSQLTTSPVPQHSFPDQTTSHGIDVPSGPTKRLTLELPQRWPSTARVLQPTKVEHPTPKISWLKGACDILSTSLTHILFHRNVVQNTRLTTEIPLDCPRSCAHLSQGSKSPSDIPLRQPAPSPSFHSSASS
jgi:hypothetical protein